MTLKSHKFSEKSNLVDNPGYFYLRNQTRSLLTVSLTGLQIAPTDLYIFRRVLISPITYKVGSENIFFSLGLKVPKLLPGTQWAGSRGAAAGQGWRISLFPADREGSSSKWRGQISQGRRAIPRYGEARGRLKRIGSLRETFED